MRRTAWIASEGCVTYLASPVVAGLLGNELTIEEVWERAEGKQPGGQQRQLARRNHRTKGYLCPSRLIVADGTAVYKGKGKTRTLVGITFRDGRTLLDYRTCDPATGDNCYVNLYGCYDDRDCPSGGVRLGDRRRAVPAAIAEAGSGRGRRDSAHPVEEGRESRGCMKCSWGTFLASVDTAPG